MNLLSTIKNEQKLNQDFVMTDEYARERLDSMLNLEHTYCCRNSIHDTLQKDKKLKFWRRQVAEWAFSVMDYYSLNRSTASMYPTIFRHDYMVKIQKY